MPHRQKGWHVTIHNVMALWKERGVDRSLGLFGAGGMDVRGWRESHRE